MKGERIYIITKWVFKPNAIEELLEDLFLLITQSQLESGNLLYHLHKSSKHENTLFLYEAYEDLNAFEKHQCSTHVLTKVRGKILPFLENKETYYLEAPLSNLKIF